MTTVMMTTTMKTVTTGVGCGCSQWWKTIERSVDDNGDGDDDGNFDEEDGDDDDYDGDDDNGVNLIGCGCSQ